MDEVLLRKALIKDGFSDGEIVRLARSGELRRLRRGAYVRAAEAEATIEERHRLLVAATLPQLPLGGTLSHGSAAVVHGLPVWSGAVERVHVTRPRRGGGQVRALVEVHASHLLKAEKTTVDGWAVTTLGRTVVDLSRAASLEHSVPALDRALHAGLDAEDLATVLDRAAHWPGIALARRAAAFADGRSESPGESLSRLRLHEAGLPAPVLQHEVLGTDGLVVARTDFAWPEQRTLGEFDGKVKYGRLVPAGGDVGAVVYREKLREDALRDLGWQVVRWSWADLYRFEEVVERLRRAFARSR